MLYAVLSVALLVLSASLVFAHRSVPPPTIAEFAPQAVEQLTRSFGESEGDAGSRDLSAGRGEQRAVAKAGGQQVEVARVRQCVGDPPRQIEDPQSPPCVPYWSGDNGGSTARGVTRDEIRIANPFHLDFSPALATFFNRRFELYGREIRLLPRAVPAEDPPGERAAAQAVYEQDQAFASSAPGEVQRTYFDELARLGVIGVHNLPLFPEAHLAQHRPYQWTYPMANDRLFGLVGSWYCARFAGRNAVHAGDPLLQATRRKAGIVLTQADREGTSAEPTTTQLSRCGEGAADVIQSSVPAYDAAYYAAFMENAMLQMKTSGVTTIACYCYVITVGHAMRAATNQGYFPEWLVTSYLYNDSLIWARALGAREQQKALLLLLARPMDRAPSDHPSNWAIQEVTNGANPTSPIEQWYRDFAYRALLLLASGLQMAGPYLTPDTFEQGLHGARFPNPAHLIMAGAVGFSDADHSMTDDAAEIWWSNTAPSPYGDGPGAFCYVDHGARRTFGTFPTDDPFFSGPCDNGME